MFLLDVFDASTSRMGVSLILTACSAAFMIGALLLTVAAACMSVADAEQRNQSSPTIDMQDLKAYRVGNRIVHVPSPHAADHSGRGPNGSKGSAKKYEPRMRPMGMEEYSVGVSVDAGGRADTGNSGHLTSEIHQLPTVAQYMAELNGKWSPIGHHARTTCGEEERQQSKERRVCKITRFGAVS
jgi:hypothetical protein